MFDFSVADFLPENSDVNLYTDLFDSLDLDDFVMDYSSQGEAAVHPAVLIARTFSLFAAEYSFREFALGPLFPLFARTFEVA
jgi:hypothetical protein